ncbi:polymerase gamma 2 [Arabidopsis thaliana]|jgi:DNA polymerase-1|uniref:DNA polymerase I A, chloroplastic/mitochondrial n=1 Tax=Arabidopsis thaliana TaxID=3702 RepID=POLIA_ARATH|nr:polymerase gamma 2 [Arabidopsis thaliana]F4I6M1.1 RecName: Full=DNA polymerase I A, chloroplastic/mitochondrial; AltName: Full=DNA polymerase PolI-like B; Short=AtPolI-like A; AltName: Full=Polymerase gamma 2; Short=POLGAMMA2; Flags: Precursor [Arabidopsis thaliana]AEE32595.1 polymerase gamma 2 [Arabidopsis thaliana]|eukprot:NP_175498.2 polymerase gamma 2 [Arabidopsis thaliana]
MAMGVSLTSHNNPLLRHLSPSSSWVSRSSSRLSSSPLPSFLFPCRRTLLQRKLASTDGNVGYCTTTVCQGFQHSVHQRSSSVVFNGEWELRSESNKVRMVPKIIKVGNQTEVAETHQVPGTVSAWREEANKLRERNGQIARNLDDNGYFNGSVPIISSAPSYETSQKIDYEFKPRGTTRSTTATLNKELIGITQSEPVVSLPRKGLDVGDNMDVNPKGEGIQRPLISDKSSGTANGNKNTVAISKVERSTEPSNVRENLGKIYDKVLIVDNVQAAKDTVAKLVNQFRNHVHSCDTEVSGIEVKEETPVDHGELICFSIYCGPEADFGNGKSCIWVDVLGENGREVLAEFKPYFEDSFIRKVWHNYSFDSHIIRNHGIEISGFHADTMHMARLWDSARRIKGGYSLEALTSDPKVLGGTQTKEEAEFLGKISMKTIFGKRKLKKDGSEGKIVVIPPVEELQREDREAWISYSALDAISTLKLYESMTKKLQLMDWHLDGKPVLGRTMLDFYHEFWRPFGELLVKMEAEGILVDREYLAEIEKVAKAEQQVAGSRFRNWASKYCPDAKYMNIGSDTQLRQLFFGGISNSHDEVLPVEKLFKVPNIDKVIEEGKKTPTKFRNIKLHRISDSPLSTENFTASGWPSVGGDVLKELAGKVSAEYDFMDDVSDISLEEVVEDDDVETSETQKSKTDDETDTSAYGTAYVAFGGGERGKEACHAIASLCEVCSIDSLISNFILPLQGSNVSGKDGRVHCSLNINTETGRLSARRPNLQNQPALEKDRYKIRKAFVASPGNTLVVADYGQLELRILAHLTGCKSMMEAFKAGGDFHSRTAMNMYPHVREAVENGQVILEWHPEPGEDKPPVPLLKDAFGSERRKAKMLNFSIAYGKTAVGLSRDWKVSTKEAQETVDLWYNDRQEVRKWQEMRKKEAIEDGYVLTLLGRSRRFPASKSRAQRNHIQRAAINTPVQGSAADVAMCAMLEISINQQLKKLGWRLLLQIHDEVILEGPIESAEIAKDIVVDCMSKPFNGRNILSVDLSVDAKCAQNWYAAK